MEKVNEFFGTKVFGDSVMQERLPKETYEVLKSTIREGKSLDSRIADIVADAMKDWAIEQGATHYTHWFQPLTGVTAEKHDSFISPKGAKALMEFSGKELIKGEPDASSFPNGGIRATFEARGYTAWDPTSFAFIKDNTLCIPTAFCSYSGEALDEKTPLLRSCEALSKQALKILTILGITDAKSVRINVGAEQEYFLIDKETAGNRPDIVYTGRTLFGAKPPKGQELDDHYFGAIKPRVKAFMEELDVELWKLGIPAKTEHNETAPSQHELASVYRTVNIATDNNQITMELMKKIADKHNLVCLLAEKPFKGVSGSGKHNNWSISTDTGINLLDPGETPGENLQFLLFLSAVIKGVDTYQDLLRASVSSAGNDNRLGSSEAPPAIISIFLGEDLSQALSAFESNTEYKIDKKFMGLGTKILPKLPKDSTDRNRTSPFAFTGNKFEFRMVGSNDSIADCNTVLNTAVAESLSIFAETLQSASDIPSAIHDIVVSTLKKHKRIIFNGNNYSKEWIKEANKRGLLNLSTTPDAINTLVDAKNVKLMEKHRVFSLTELTARQQVMFEKYSHIINIEALTMIDMAKKQIYPAVNEYIVKLSKAVQTKTMVNANCQKDKDLIVKLSSINEKIYEKAEELNGLLNKSYTVLDKKELAFFTKKKIIKCMNELRDYADEAECNTAEHCWPYPTYGKLLFSVK